MLYLLKTHLICLFRQHVKALIYAESVTPTTFLFTIFKKKQKLHVDFVL